MALRLVEHLRLLTDEIDELTAEITIRVTTIAPSLLAIVGCGALTARRLSVKQRTPAGSAPKTHSPVTMAPRRYQCGHRTSNGIACRATGIGNSTRQYTALH